MSTIQGLTGHRAAGPLPATVRRHRLTAVLVGGAVLVGLGLRIAAARGDLWLDEVWSLRLVAEVRSADAVFWGVSHDNNHFLNSLWLYLLGPDRAPWAYRALSVALGTSSIALAARVGLRRGLAAGVAGAWLAALATPLVVSGSEARGYAGLVFATLLAIEAFERALDAPTGASSGWRSSAARRLGFAIGVGTLFHLTMLAALAILGATALLRFRARGMDWRCALDAALDLFGPSLVALLPAMLAIVAGIAACGGFTFGDIVPFGPTAFASGYGEQLRLMLAVPPGAPSWAVFATAGLFVAAASHLARADPARRTLILVALLLLPGTMALAHLPNLEFPRYFLVPGVVLVVAEADLVGRLWDGGGARRLAGSAVVAAVLAGQAAADASMLNVGRGDYSAVLAMMSSEGRPTYTADSRFMVEAVARFAGDRTGVTPIYVPPQDFCSNAPMWFVRVLGERADPDPTITAGPVGCRVRFEKRALFPASGLSGMRWTLYRRAA